jgi:endonuclease YncB( thermonuclease family)
VALVTGIVDGDTIHINIAGEPFKLRYIGIDAPEMDSPSGPIAREANRRLVEGQTVYLEKDVSDTDRYGRLLRYVYLADGTFVNAELIRQGYAVAKAYPPDTRHHRQLSQLQDEARRALRGLWKATPTPPVPSGVGAPK